MVSSLKIIYQLHLHAPVSCNEAGLCCIFLGMAAAAAAVLEVPLMTVTPQKEAAMAVNVRIEEGTILAAVVEVTVAVTEDMGDQIVVTHPLIVVMALLQTAPGQGAMAVEPHLRGLTLRGHILEVSLKNDVEPTHPFRPQEPK